MENKKKDTIALATGFSLIILVVIFTLFREKLFPSSNDSLQSQDDTSSKQVSTTPKYETISADNLNKKIMLSEKKDSMILLDIRPFEKYANEHILDATNISLDEFPVGSKIDRHGLVVVIGENKDDKDIDKAVEKLKSEKFQNISVLAGGMDSWTQLIGATVTYGNPKSFADQSKVSFVKPEDINETLNQKIPVFIVDVRFPDEFAKGHIQNAINIPFNDLEKRRSEVNGRNVMIVGVNELQEFQAGVQLYDMLLIKPAIMRGGMPQWEKLTLPSVK